MWAIYDVVTIAMWMINILLIILVLWMFIWVGKLIYSILKNKNRHDAIKKQVDEEMSAKMNLPIGEAWKSAEIVLQERAQCEKWDKPPSQEIKDIISKLDCSIQDLFGKYKKILFSDNGTLISAECLLEETHAEGEYVVGKNACTNDVLRIRTDSPRIYEVYKTTVKAVYPSLIHYIAFIEDDLNWD
jgi:hypothetical protein